MCKNKIIGIICEQKLMEESSMRKRMSALVIVWILIVSIPLVSYASPRLNMSIFESAEDITIKYDDMTNATTISSTSLLKGEGDIRLDYNYDYVSIYPRIIAITAADEYTWNIDYFAKNWMFIDEISIKVGEHIYTFTDFTTSRKVYSDGTIQEHLALGITNDSTSFMQDLIEHRNEKIKVRLSSDSDRVDFFLPDKVKDGIINVYNLYSMAGGMNSENMKLITAIEDTKVTVRSN